MKIAQVMKAAKSTKKIFAAAIIFLGILGSFGACFANSKDTEDIEHKIGQMIIVGFDGATVRSAGFKRALRQVEKGEISGVILFQRNIKSKKDLSEMAQELKNAPAKAVRKGKRKQTIPPPFVAIDMEGGNIARYDFERYQTARGTAARGKDFAGEEYQKMAKLQSELGINLNFAPVVDLEINPNSIISIKERAFSENPEEVAEFAKIFINAHKKYNIQTSAKHFPGHGSATGDTHRGFVDATKCFSEAEIEPYRLLKDEVPIVMVSHIYNQNIDPDYPASLSEKTVKGLLKQEIGFRGVVVSDDYDMGAIRDNYTLEQIALRAVKSGIDLMIFSNNLGYNDPRIAAKIRRIIKRGIKKGEIDPSDILKSADKILELKAAQ